MILLATCFSIVPPKKRSGKASFLNSYGPQLPLLKSKRNFSPWTFLISGIAKLKEFVHTESSSSLTLSQIWLAHMRFVFDKIGIVPEVIMVNIRSIVRQTVDEDQIHSLL